MYTSLKFKIKDSVVSEKRRLLELFFRDWVDDSCDSQVQYSFESIDKFQDILLVDFDTQEDALALKLKGIPEEFRQYIDIVN